MIRELDIVRTLVPLIGYDHANGDDIPVPRGSRGVVIVTADGQVGRWMLVEFSADGHIWATAKAREEELELVRRSARVGTPEGAA